MKEKSAEAQAKSTTPAMTRNSKKSYPTTVKQVKELVYYDPRPSVVKLGT